MSLDVYLTITKRFPEKYTGIFIRENGEFKELSEGEWYKKFPGEEPLRLEINEIETNEVYHANITHNLKTMANKAGIYEYLWRPEEVNITKAIELIEPLKQGLQELKKNPTRYKKFNPENGWGSYEGLVEFVESYLTACQEYPDADIEVSR
jgi:hypothetical protein